MPEPGGKLLVAPFRGGVVAGVSPFAQSGLDKAFGLAVGARGIGARELVADAELGARGVEEAG
jgi:hypothetical protein